MTRLRWWGTTAAVAGLLGAASSVAVIAWPAQVADNHYSYPFDAGGYTAAQIWFAVQHLGLLAGLYGLAVLARPRIGRVTRAGLVVAMAGIVVLSACEIFAITAADDLVGSAAGDAVDNVYGVPMILIGIAMVVAGVGLARRRVLPGWRRWIPAAIGGYVFVPLFPAVFGPLVLGRMAIGVWMLLYAALGVALIRAGQTDSEAAAASRKASAPVRTAG
jgi:hypothetical protein